MKKVIQVTELYEMNEICEDAMVKARDEYRTHSDHSEKMQDLVSFTVNNYKKAVLESVGYADDNKTLDLGKFDGRVIYSEVRNVINRLLAGENLGKAKSLFLETARELNDEYELNMEVEDGKVSANTYFLGLSSYERKYSDDELSFQQARHKTAVSVIESFIQKELDAMSELISEFERKEYEEFDSDENVTDFIEIEDWLFSRDGSWSGVTL